MWGYINGLWIDKPPGLRSGSKLDPAPTSEEWDAMKETYVWTNKRLVHIWEMPFGWNFSTFNHQTTEASSGKLVQFFLYGRARQMFSHDLELEKYGTEGEWVIIQKVSK